jgi:hypothetical protein
MEAVERQPSSVSRPQAARLKIRSGGKPRVALVQDADTDVYVRIQTQGRMRLGGRGRSEAEFVGSYSRARPRLCVTGWKIAIPGSSRLTARTR